MNADGVLAIANFCIFPIHDERVFATKAWTTGALGRSATYKIRVLLRDISKILFPNNPVNVPVIK